MLQETCNCGRPVRYVSHEGNSCNKYGPCPTYADLVAEVDRLRKEIVEHKARADQWGKVIYEKGPCLAGFPL